MSTTVRRSPDWLIDQLPVAMVQEDFFRRFVSIFQDVGTSYLEHADGIPHLVQVDVTPAPMLPWLGSWVGVDVVDPELDEVRQRRLVATACRALAWRGTRVGLQAWLEVITDAPVTIEDPGGVFRKGGAPMQAPILRVHTAGTGWMTEREFTKVVLAEIPVHLSLELYIDHRLVHPSLAPTDHAVAEAAPVDVPLDASVVDSTAPEGHAEAPDAPDAPEAPDA